MFECVVVPLDGSKLSEKALPALPRLLRGEERKVVLLHTPVPGASFLVPAAEFVRREKRRATRYLAGKAAALRRRGLSIETVVEPGEPSRVINRVALRKGADLIVMSSHGRGAASEWALGSVAERVLRTARLPVLVLRGGKTPALRHLLVPLDGSPRSLDVMSAVGELAEAAGARVSLLHVGKRRPSLARAVDLLARLDIPHRVLQRRGRPVETVLKVARSSRADVLAVASATRPGDTRLTFGPVAEALLRKYGRPVLFVPARRDPEPRDAGSIWSTVLADN